MLQEASKMTSTPVHTSQEKKMIWSIFPTLVATTNQQDCHLNKPVLKLKATSIQEPEAIWRKRRVAVIRSAIVIAGWSSEILRATNGKINK